MGYHEGFHEDDGRNNLGNRGEGNFVDIEQVPDENTLSPDEALMRKERTEKNAKKRRNRIDELLKRIPE